MGENEHDLDEAFYAIWDNLESFYGKELLELKKAIEEELEKREAIADLYY